ncbi:MAG TPA: hypothetical protein PLQ18_08415, partial [Plasticicumulans sp.]|nr:hypothetical protein [Plasticicumulans sp.]
MTSISSSVPSSAKARRIGSRRSSSASRHAKVSSLRSEKPWPARSSSPPADDSPAGPHPRV